MQAASASRVHLMSIDRWAVRVRAVWTILVGRPRQLKACMGRIPMDAWLLALLAVLLLAFVAVLFLEPTVGRGGR